MTVIRWEAPQRRGNPKYAEIVAALKANPGEWALVAEDVSPSFSSHMKRKYGLEVTLRGIRDGRAEKAYARWNEEEAA